MARTTLLRQKMPEILAGLGVTRMLDAGCGDFNWMRDVEIGSVHYHGVDLVDAMIATNNARFGTPTRQFSVADVVNDPLPKVDLIFSRDCLFHLSNSDVMKAIENFRRTGAQWLLTTSEPSREKNDSIASGSYRPLNLCAEPFCFPPPEETIADTNREVGLWKMADIPRMYV
jgi:SAM-dependent methyltransferase